MTVKEYLEQYAEAVRLAEVARKAYKAEQDKIDAIRSGIGDGQPRGTKISKPVEEKATELADKCLEWQWLELEALEIRQDIMRLIRTVPGVGKDILIERYINGKTWEEVGKAVGYSKSRAHALHDEALDFLEKK